MAIVYGTGSKPPRRPLRLKGWHRATRATAIADPRHQPWRATAIAAYSEHVGWKRHPLGIGNKEPPKACNPGEIQR